MDTLKVITLGRMVKLSRDAYDELITATDEDFDGLVFTD
jgi:hypothetical protein